MSMIINAYHLKKERLKALLTALTQVNTAEEAQQNINRVQEFNYNLFLTFFNSLLTHMQQW